MRRPWTFDLHVGADTLELLEQGMGEALEALRLRLAHLHDDPQLAAMDGLELTERGIVMDVRVALATDPDAPTANEQALAHHEAQGGALSPGRLRRRAELEERAEAEADRDRFLARAGFPRL